jgi:hypothetical protein
MQTTLSSVKADTSSILRLSEQHRDELRQTRSVLIRAIFDATEVSTPTAFVVLKEELPSAEKEAQLAITLKDDGTGFVAKGEAVDAAKGRYEEGTKWLNLCAQFGRGVATCSPSAIADAVKGACGELVVGEEWFLYLIDELTGKPVVPKTDEDKPKYPIRIIKPAEIVAKLLPVMQVGLHAASLVNGVAGVVRLFGYPCPKVPKAWRAGAQNSVEVLKQERARSRPLEQSTRRYRTEAKRQRRRAARPCGNWKRSLQNTIRRRSTRAYDASATTTGPQCGRC